MATVRNTTEYPTEKAAQAARDAFLQFFPPFGYDSGAQVYFMPSEGVWKLDTYRAGAC